MGPSNLLLFIAVSSYFVVCLITRNMNSVSYCIKSNRITIIPDFIDDDVLAYHSWLHLLILVRSLVRDKCMETSIYSPEHKRYVGIDTENVDNIFATARFGEDDKIEFVEVLNYVLDVEMKTKNVEETLLYIYFPREDAIRSKDTRLSNQLKFFDEKKNHNVIFLCLYPSYLCTIGKEWLPQHHFVLFSALAKQGFITDITKIMLDLLRNPNHNRYIYHNNLNYQCKKKSNKFEIYFWMPRGPGGRRDQTYFNTFYVLNFFITRFRNVNVFMVLKLGNSYVTKPAESFLFPSYSNNASERWRDLNTRLKSSNATVIHVNYEKKDTMFDRDEDILRTDNTVNIIVNTDIPKSPFLQNDLDIMIREDDYMNYDFFTLLIDRIYFISCHMK